MPTKETLTENRGWTWFQFDAKNWVTSRDILNMTSSEEGLYIRMLAFQWMYDELPADPRQLAKLLGRDPRQVTGFMKKWGDKLFPKIRQTSEDSCNPLQSAANGSESLQSSEHGCKVRNPKLHFLAISKGKFGLDDVQSRADTDGNEEENKPPAAAMPFAVAVSSKQSVPASGKTGFDPLTFEAEITSRTGKVYPAERVRQILSCLFLHHPSEYWTDPAQGNITSVSRLRTAIDAMAEQVPEDWQPPAPKKPKTRTVGDLNCMKCRGQGVQDNRAPGSLVIETIQCDCTKHEQVYEGGQWVDVK